MCRADGCRRGLKDSLSSVSAKQFGPIIDYQAIVTLIHPRKIVVKSSGYAAEARKSK